MDRKKEIERHYLDEARRASSIFPPGEFVPDERPDFLKAGGTLGVEMTVLCREAPRAEAGRLANVAPRAKALYSKHPDAKPVDVSPVFSRYAERMKVGALGKQLADFVYSHRDDDADFAWPHVPEGYIHIGVFPALDAQGRWLYFRRGNTVLAQKELIEERIAEKNERVVDYRARASEVWLLIVNDLFLGPGEVFVRPDDLARWTFSTAFDKVLLFSHQPGGSGDVIELRCR